MRKGKTGWKFDIFDITDKSIDEKKKTTTREKNGNNESKAWNTMSAK